MIRWKIFIITYYSIHPTNEEIPFFNPIPAFCKGIFPFAFSPFDDTCKDSALWGMNGLSSAA